MRRVTILSVAGTLMVLASCSPGKKGDPAPASKRMELDTNSIYYDQQYSVYTLEGCEYIVVGYGNLRWGSHKGNCCNPIHQKSFEPAVFQPEEALFEEEKHFDCRVEECSKGTDGKWMVFTECGIYFESEKAYKQGEVLRNFQSPKHK